MCKKKKKHRYNGNKKRIEQVCRPAAPVNTFKQRLGEINRLKPILEAARTAQQRARQHESENKRKDEKT